MSDHAGSDCPARVWLVLACGATSGGATVFMLTVVVEAAARGSARQRVWAGRGHEPLGHPVVDVMEPVVEWASIELDGCPQ